MRDEYESDKNRNAKACLDAASVAPCVQAPTPQTVESFLDQRLMRLMSQLHEIANEIAHVTRLKLYTPTAILRSSAADLRELHRYL